MQQSGHNLGLHNFLAWKPRLSIAKLRLGASLKSHTNAPWKLSSLDLKGKIKYSWRLSVGSSPVEQSYVSIMWLIYEPLILLTKTLVLLYFTMIYLYFT